MPEDGEDVFYLGVSRNVARRVHPDLAEVTAGLDDNTLGGLARTLVGLMADGADPRQPVNLLMEVGHAHHNEYLETNAYTVCGDGTGEGEEVRLEFNGNDLE